MNDGHMTKLNLMGDECVRTAEQNSKIVYKHNSVTESTGETGEQ